jgi:hypothetical protein
MPPKTAEKKPQLGGKGPAKGPAEKKEAGKKTAAPSGDKKKSRKTRKETYSSYIYKGKGPVHSTRSLPGQIAPFRAPRHADISQMALGMLTLFAQC